MIDDDDDESLFPEDGEWTTRPQNSPLPKVLKLYIFATSQDKRADFLKALDSLVNSKFVEKEMKDFDKLSRDKVTIFKQYKLKLLKGAYILWLSILIYDN